ncbi:hypothetical protein HYS28_00555 [Candidatus Uhrbacteria bacterium]|nr:hypothetical protein [Candidatus Uhrbacteria bacterium]
MNPNHPPTAGVCMPCIEEFPRRTPPAKMTPNEIFSEVVLIAVHGKLAKGPRAKLRLKELIGKLQVPGVAFKDGSGTPELELVARNIDAIAAALLNPRGRHAAPTGQPHARAAV